MRFYFLLGLFFSLMQLSAQELWLPNFTGRIEVEMQEIEWLGIDNLYDTSSSEQVIWINQNDSQHFHFLLHTPKNSYYQLVKDNKEISFDTLSSEKGRHSNYVSLVNIPPMLVRGLWTNSGDYFHDVFLKSLLLDTFYENENEYYIYAENAGFSHEAEGKRLSATAYSVSLVFGSPERKDWRRTNYTLRLSDEKIDSTLSWLWDDSLFSEAKLALFQSNMNLLFKDQRSNRDEIVGAYMERSFNEPVELRYFYFENIITKAGRTFQSFFEQDSVLLFLYISKKSVPFSRHLKVLEYYLKKYPEKRVNFALMIISEKDEEIEGLSAELLAHSYRVSRYEANRLGMSESRLQIVNEQTKELYKSGGLAKMEEILNTYW